ncbi:MAG: cryptochrome/photolyase family protein [Bdellovibrionales bacterium]
MAKYKKSLVWIRRDLRLLDHAALSAASQQSEYMAVVFVFDTEILKKLKNKKDSRVNFIFESLQELDHELKKAGSQLIILKGNPTLEIPKLIKELNFDALFYNEDYEPYAIKRDSKVKDILAKEKIPSFSSKDHVIFSGTEVLKKDLSPYQVFTPYKNAWLKKLSTIDIKIRPVKKNYLPSKNLTSVLTPLTIKELGFEKTDVFYDFQKPGRKNGVKHLKDFSKSIKQYKNDRDFPWLMGTSGLSTHLRFGTVSIRECVRMCLQLKSIGAHTWLSELIWRDFYQMILLQFPHVTSRAFKEKYSTLNWPGSNKHLKAWCDGKTGYPIVDAAMRQLNTTGWMHNRLRMVTASFLTKDLLINWQEGEAYFAEKLLDFDLASNNGGWQWSASTGCDAQPYFRVFNPELQSKKFDPEGVFLRKWLPELKSCSSKEIHKPIDVDGYPKQIVEHQDQKALAIELFKKSH